VRKEKGLTIRELSNLSGVNRSTINEIENEITMPRVDTLGKIARALGVSLDELCEY